MLRILTIAMLVAACRQAGAAPGILTIVDMAPASRLQDGKTVESGRFGGSVDGRALWLSANGRYTAMFRLTDDTDRNGKLEIHFGMHGDSWGDDLALDVFDIETGKHQRFDDFLTADPQDRYAVLRRGDDTVLFDSADGTVRNLYDLGGGAPADANHCMAPRQIAFDPAGEHIALLRDQPAEVVIHSLVKGNTRVVYRAAKPVWRVEFTGDPSRLLTIDSSGEFPQQRTSCVSLSRTVFAASYSMMGLDSDELSYAFVDLDGHRHALSAAPVLLSPEAYALPKAKSLRTFQGGAVGIPEGCELAESAEGSRVVILKCGATTELFDPVSGDRRALPGGQSMLFVEGTLSVGPDGTWYAVSFPIAGATDRSNARFHLGRLRLTDLRLERGPAVFGYRRTGNPSWIAGDYVDDYYMLNVGTGALLTARAKDMTVQADQFALRTGKNSFLLLDPDRRTQAPLRGQSGIGNGRGCFLAEIANRGPGWRDMDTGPWKRVCIDERR